MAYQVFLSFKNTSDEGVTVDKEITEQLYQYLTSKGVTAFYSNISLIQFGEAQYKEAIDNALDEVRIMVVISTKAEFITSRWCRYEWDNYLQNIVNGIVKGSVITFLSQDILLKDVPVGIRNYQSFKIEQTPIEKLGDFILAALEKEYQIDQKEASVPINHSIAPNTPNTPSFRPLIHQNGDISAEEKIDNEYKTMQEKITAHERGKSTFDIAWAGENKRQKLQSHFVQAIDEKAINKVKEEIGDISKHINILDLGCGYGEIGRDRFSDFKDKTIIGIDNSSEEKIELAKEKNTDPEHCFYYYVDFDEEDFDEKLEAIMEQHGIEKFDVIFGGFVIQRVDDPFEVLRNLRRVLAENGFIILRNSDDGMVLGYEDDGLVSKILSYHNENVPNISDRYVGRKLFHYLDATGYSDTCVYTDVINTSEMDFDELMDLYTVKFSILKNICKHEVEKNPEDEKLKTIYDWISSHLDKLKEKFGNDSFFMLMTYFAAVARKKPHSK